MSIQTRNTEWEESTVQSTYRLEVPSLPTTSDHDAAQVQQPFEQTFEEQLPSSAVEVCSGVNCGEAGCLARDNKPVCLCIYSPKPWPPPDENLRCNRSVVNPISPGSFPQPPFPGFPWHIQAESRSDQSSAKTLGLRMPSPSLSSVFDLGFDSASRSGGGGGGGGAGTGSWALPAAIGGTSVLALAFFAVVTAFALLRRRRGRRCRGRGRPHRPSVDKDGGGGGLLSSPVAWLQRTDGSRVFDRLMVVSGNEAYYTRDIFIGGGGACDEVDARTKRIPIDHLRLEKEIGEGTFGKVYKGVVTSGVGEVGVTEVAVKILKDDVSREMQSDFRREVEIMTSFDHVNILKLIGVVCRDYESPYMVFEFMEYGDLTDILRRNDPSLEKAPRSIELKASDLVGVSLQIVRGMLYLSGRHFVHRDLATRNCLVGSGFVVKIADFGMSRDLYTYDYYKVGGNRHLPVRWMAPESIKYGRYGTETDVWSYGVVLWEIFAFGRQPYYGHSNEEAIRFIEDGILLQKPSGCSDTVYHVMLGCWRRDATERFTFERIHRHLVEYEANRKQ